MGNIIKNITGNFMLIPRDNCLLLKDQECKVRKVIGDNHCMTYPYKIWVNRCTGSCNDKDNPYFKICLPDSIKSISVFII